MREDTEHISSPVAAGVRTAWRARRAVSSVVLIAACLLAGCGDSSRTSQVGNTVVSGALLRDQRIQVFEYAAGTPLVPIVNVSAYRVGYTSTDHRGKLRTVTGAVMTPTTPWNGPGQRPGVSYASGTQCVGDACGPPYALTTGTNYEAPIIQTLLNQGYAVVATDYTGVGTEEPSTYINRIDQGHAVLDLVRAARKLPAAQLPADGPVLVMGYSQGGLGAAAALELHPSYAPELNLIGGFAGSIPSEILAVVESVERSQFTSLLGNFLNGLDAAFPENALPSAYSAEGRRFAQAASQECAPAIFLTHPLVDSSALFTDGRPLSQHLRDRQWQRPLADQLVGRSAPTAPVLVISSIVDDIVPEPVTRAVVDGWCSLGATIQYDLLLVPGHIPAAFAAVPLALPWLSDRVAGRPASSNCAPP